MHSKGGRASCLWLLRALLSGVTRADMIGFLVCVSSWSLHGMSSEREKQFFAGKRCVSRRRTSRNLPISVSLTVAWASARRAVRSEPSPMREEHGRHAGQFGWPVEHQRPRNPVCTEGLWFHLGATPTLIARAQARRLQARGYERARGER